MICPPASFQRNILREVEHITEIATAEFERRKALWEQDLMERMRNAATDCRVENLADIGEMTRSLLTLIREFCRCDYAVIFANICERETVLSPIGHAGMGTALHDQLPHFNWRNGYRSGD